MDSQLPSEESNVPVWQEVSLGEPFPVYVGQYKIRAELAFDVEMAERFEDRTKHSSTDEIEIGLDDNLGWRDHLARFDHCEYDAKLTLIPDGESIAVLRKHLEGCTGTFAEPYARVLHEIVWLKMQVEKPELYSRMLDLERIRLPFRGQDEAELQKTELEQARLSAKSDADLIRTWFHDQYRDLLLETARQFVLDYKSHPQLHRNEDFESDIWDGFENWQEAAASLVGGADSYVSREELVHFLKRAGRSQKDIAAFIKNQKSDIPLILPEYHY